MTDELAGRPFTEIVREEGPGLLRFARTLVRRDHEAEDLAQDTFVRAYERRDQFRGESSLATWLHRICYRLALDRSRRASPQLIEMETIEQHWRDDAFSVDPERVLERAEQREALEDALVRIPFEYRVAVLLHDVDGWTVAQVAEALDSTVEATKKRLQRGRMALVSALATAAERRFELQGVPLRCWDARAAVSDYLDGALADDERSALERHLATCPTCPPLVAALSGATNALTKLRDDDRTISPDLRDRIRAALGDTDAR